MPRPNYDLIPPITMGGLQRYIVNGTPCGHFLTAVLSGDLFEAYKRADEDNIAAMFHLVSYIYNEIPGNCWGSKAAVEEWIASKNPISDPTLG